MTNRIRLYKYLLVLAFIALIFRLYYWQIIKGEELSEQARSQYVEGVTIQAERGSILASDGTWLAANTESFLIYANPTRLEKDPKDIAEVLAPLMVESDERKELLLEIDRIEGILRKDGQWVPIKRRVSKELKEKIEQFNIHGIEFEESQIRFYPEASTSAHLMGFVGKDENGQDRGYFGLEGYYDLTLKGKEGYISRESDGVGLPMILGDSREVSAVSGVDLYTNLDKRIQINVDSILKKGIEKYSASAGTVIIMEPNTGAIKAMSSFPSYSPASYFEYNDELFKNPAVSSTFEPGSVFKVVIMAAALDSGAVTPDTICSICAGPVKIDKYTIGTWDDHYYPDSTMTDVIVHSDNVGMVFVGKQLGKQKLVEYLKAFGINELTEIDLQGETTANFRPEKNWGEVDVATATFGQGIATTPIQLVRAVGALANDGIMLTPQVVDRIGKDGWEEDIGPESGRRVISKESADQITAMMAKAAQKGESKWTHRSGFGVAGKTGTAQIPIQGHYDEEKTIASFVGFAPYNDPKFLMLVTLREPQSSPWASETAAPLWYEIAEDLFIYYGIQPDN